MRRTLCILLAAVFCAALIPTCAGAEEPETALRTDAAFPAPIGEPDPEATPIATRADLEAVAEDPGGSYVLTGDIDLGDSLWLPLEEFSGTLDGQGHAIRNLRITEASAARAKTPYVGLFSHIGAATVKNLCLDGADVRCGWGQGHAQTTGGLSGRIDDSTVENCVLSGSVAVTFGTGGAETGGVCGDSYQSVFTDCVSFCDVSVSWSKEAAIAYGIGPAGGLVGEGTYDLYRNCWSAGSVSGLCTAGGLAGCAVQSSARTCVNLGPVTGDCSTVGGLFGYAQVNENSGMVQCLNLGEIRTGYTYDYSYGSYASSDLCAGGIFGSLQSSGGGAVCSQCVNLGPVTARETFPPHSPAAGGIAGNYTIDHFYGAPVTGTLRDCLNRGTVRALSATGESSSPKAGGVVGYGFINGDHQLVLSRCYSAGSVQAAASQYAAYAGVILGLCGFEGAAAVDHSFALCNAVRAAAAHDPDTQPGPTAGEIAGTGNAVLTDNAALEGIDGVTRRDADEELYLSRTVTAEPYLQRGWDFDTVWAIPSGGGFPTQQWLQEIGGAVKQMDLLRELAARTVSHKGYLITLTGELFAPSSRAYSQPVALLSAALSDAAENDARDGAEVRQLYLDLGFRPDRIRQYNYDGLDLAGWADSAYAFTIAHKHILVNGQMENLLSVTTCGTQTLPEALGDLLPLHDKAFLGSSAYRVAWEYQQAVQQALGEYIQAMEDTDLDELPLKVLLNGHSLGGAAADLEAAWFTNYAAGGAWWSGLCAQRDIFAYTFGAIDAIWTGETVDCSRPVSAGYENIHNIYNLYDTYGPYNLRTDIVSGKGLLPGLGAAGNTIYGKFGHIDMFSCDFSNRNDSITAVINHRMEGYLTAVAGQDPIGHGQDGMILTLSGTDSLEVTRKGASVISLRDGAVTIGSEAFGVRIGEEGVTLYLPDWGGVDVDIPCGPEDGIDGRISDAGGDGAEKYYEGVALAGGGTLRLALGLHGGAASARLYVLDNDSNPESMVTPDGSTVPVTPCLDYTDLYEQENGLVFRGVASNPGPMAYEGRLVAVAFDGEGRMLDSQVTGTLRILPRETVETPMELTWDGDLPGGSGVTVKLFFVHEQFLLPLSDLSSFGFVPPGLEGGVVF